MEEHDAGHDLGRVLRVGVEDRVGEGLRAVGVARESAVEEAAEHGLAASARHHGQTRLQRNRRLDQLRTVVAAPGQRRAVDPRQGHTQQRRRHVRPVVDVLCHRRPAAPSHQRHRVDVEE